MNNGSIYTGDKKYYIQNKILLKFEWLNNIDNSSNLS